MNHHYQKFTWTRLHLDLLVRETALLDALGRAKLVAAVDDEFSIQPALPVDGEILAPEQESEEQFHAILSRLGRIKTDTPGGYE